MPRLASRAASVSVTDVAHLPCTSVGSVVARVVPCRSPVWLRRPCRAVGRWSGRARQLAFMRRESCVEDVVQGAVRRSGDNSPGLPNLVDTAARRRPMPSWSRWWIESFPRRSEGRPGQVGFPARRELFPAVPPAEQDMREVGLPAVEGGAEPGGSARCPQRRVSRACCPQIPVLGPAGRSIPAALRARTTDERRAVGGRGGGLCRRVSRRRGCGCATGPTGCSMRCRCGSCPRRRTGRPRCAGGGCRWCRCSTNRTAAGARPVWPRRPLQSGSGGERGRHRRG